MKKAFITGITGQDGSYLAELLLSKDYEVHGLIRRSSTFNTDRIDHLYRDIHDPAARMYLHYGDLSVSGQMTDLLACIRPDEIYNLGAQSHVRVSFDMPEYTGDVTGLGTFEAAGSNPEERASRRSSIQASSSEIVRRRSAAAERTHPHSGRRALTRRPKSMPITWSRTTGRLTTSLPATASSSTMSLPEGEKLL